VIGGEEFLVHPGFVVEAFEVGEGQELEQISIAGIVLSQKNNVMVSCATVTLSTVPAALWRHVDLTTQDGLNPKFVGFYIEFESAVHVAVISNGDGRHAESCGSPEHVGDADGTV
jgi:hypothetical protein